MNGRRVGTRVVAVCALASLMTSNSASMVRAQELATDAERSWRDLRGSSDVRTKLLAERWYSVVKLQEWSNDTGKFTTNAKYLEHDPELGWVKLRIVQGAGSERIVKEVTIPLAKLSKTCQARVRQIHALAAKIDEAKVEEEKRKAEEKDGAPATNGGEMRESEMPAEEPAAGRDENRRGRRDRREFEAERAGANPEDALSQDPSAGRAESGATASVSSTPLPAMLPNLPTTRIASTALAGAEGSSPAAASAPSGDDAWRTSYDAFRANIQVQRRGSELYTFDWGPMQALKNAYEVNKRWEDYGSVGEEALAEIGAALDAVGEVTWEATLKEVPAADGDWNAALDLPALPEPWELTFMLDEQQDPTALASLKPGDHVRFTGRFEAFDETYSIVVSIRFAADPSMDRDRR